MSTRRKTSRQVQPLGHTAPIVRAPEALAAGIVPVSVRKLTGKAASTLAEFQRTVRVIQVEQARLDKLAWELRAAGVSWAALGWASGLSVEGARRRWGQER